MWLTGRSFTWSVVVISSHLQLETGTTLVHYGQQDQLANPVAGGSWYAIYTRANHEKVVAAQLKARAVDHFFPVYRSVRRWRDRRVQLDLPLFPGYVFVRLKVEDRLKALQIPSVVSLVGFNGTPAVLPDVEVEALRSALSRNLEARPHPFLEVGRRVRITKGPAAGLSGVLKRRKNGCWMVVSIDLVQRSMIVTVQDTDLTP